MPDGVASARDPIFVLERGMLKKARWIAGLSLLSAAVLSTQASAADLRLSATSSLGLSCQVAGVRAGLQEGRFGGFVQGALCRTGVQGQGPQAAFDVGLTFDVFDAGLVHGYVLAGGGVQAGSSVLFAGVGARAGLDLVPVEGFLEAGVQRVNTILAPIYGPRLTLGVTYRVNVGDLGRLAGTGGAAAGENVPGSGAAPETCNLTPEQDEAAVRAATVSAANQALTAIASSYSAGFSSFSYKVNVGSVSINGNNATANGSVTINLVARGSNTPTSDTYPGSVNLVRSGCGWRATGYTRG